MSVLLPPILYLEKFNLQYLEELCTYMISTNNSKSGVTRELLKTKLYRNSIGIFKYGLDTNKYKALSPFRFRIYKL